MRFGLLLLLWISVARGVHGQDAADTPRDNSDVAVRTLTDRVRDWQPPKWTYSDLAAKSDLIVIAKVISRVKTEWDGTIAGEFSETSVNCVSSNLQVLSTLKGRSVEEVVVMTLEWNPPVIVLTTSDFAELRTELLLPDLVRVVFDGRVTGYGAAQPIKTYKTEPEYLLYLRRVEGKQYVPVTGQRFSGMSVRLLNN